jgi:methyltransferase (TIGR00027 family)
VEKTELFGIKISDISVTLLLTLYSRALESTSKDPILHDEKAVEVMQKLNQELSKSKSKLLKRLSKGNLSRNLIVYNSIRAKNYDEYVRNFLLQSPNGVVVNIGCGLDTRFWRVDNGEVLFYDLDLPEVIEIKKHFFEENDRYHFIASSVFDYDWMSLLLPHKMNRILFVAEGVFMYLNKEDVKTLVIELQSQFPGSELVCEVFNDIWLRKPLRSIISFKMQKQLFLGKGAVYNFGVRDSKEIEEWSPGIKLMDEWSYFDSSEKKLGWLRLFRGIRLFRKTQYTVHYKLG